MTGEMLHIKNLTAGYGKQSVLQHVSLSIQSGEFSALIGSNGAGKSTLLKCISGLLPVTDGQISICGRDIRQLNSRERARLVAVVPQSYTVDYSFTAEDVVAMGRYPYHSFRGTDAARDADVIQHAMELTNTHATALPSVIIRELETVCQKSVILIASAKLDKLHVCGSAKAPATLFVISDGCLTAITIAI